MKCSGECGRKAKLHAMIDFEADGVPHVALDFCFPICEACAAAKKTERVVQHCNLFLDAYQSNEGKQVSAQVSINWLPSSEANKIAHEAHQTLVWKKDEAPFRAKPALRLAT